MHGPRAADALAYTYGALATIVPLLGDDRWDDTCVTLPGGAWTDLVTGGRVDGGRVPLRDVFARFPVAVLHREGA